MLKRDVYVTTVDCDT